MTLEEYLSIPYILAVDAFEAADGQWFRRAAYPELPGCVAEALWIEDAIDEVEEMRVRFIVDRLTRGELIPIPRPPLRSLNYERFHLSKQLNYSKPVEGTVNADR
jgi:predicted RNase H-like HicB family nuclease